MPSIINATTSTGLVSSADNSGSLQLATNNGTTAVTIDTSQNVGIGTTSPQSKLETTVSNGTHRLGVNGSDTNYNIRANSGSNCSITWTENGQADRWTVGCVTGQNYLAFRSNSSNMGNGDERMRIGSDGNLLVGTTSNYGTARTSINNSGTVLGLYCSGASGQPAMVIGKQSNDASTSQVLMQFLYNNGGSGLGQINGNGGSQAAFGSYSDIRLKENINDIPPQLEKVCALRPVEFDYKDGSGHQTGFIAQEMQEVYPEAVAVGQNEMLTVTGWNKTEAYLVKAIQELNAKVEAQAVRIAELEGAK